MKGFLRFLGLADGGPDSVLYAASGDASTIVGTGMTMKGEIKGPGSVVMLGAFEGDILLDGTLHVGPEAQVDANISAASIVIVGVVHGKRAANSSVAVLASG